jgi:hypothetical protein
MYCLNYLPLTSKQTLAQKISFFAYRNESDTFLHANRSESSTFYTKNRSESSTFCIILFHLLGDDCQSIPTFCFVIFL